MRFASILLLLLTAIIAAPASAADWRPLLLIHSIAAHPGSHPNRHYRWRTPGLGIGATDGFWSFAAGAYRNSDNGHSRYVAANTSWKVFSAKPWQIRTGIMFGAVWGYPISPLPIGGATLTVWHGSVGVGILAVPPSKVSSSAIQLVFRVRL